MIIPKAVVFDVAGVLLDTRPGKNMLIDHLKTTPEEFDKAFDKYRGIGDLGIIGPETVINNIAKDVGVKNAEGDNLLNVYLSACLPLYQGYYLALDLKRRGHPLGLCTNTWKDLSERYWPNVKVDGKPIFSIFDVVIESCYVGTVKPRHDIYMITEKRLGVYKSNVLFIDDDEQNITSASVYGWRTFHFQAGEDFGEHSTNQIRKIFDFR